MKSRARQRPRGLPGVPAGGPAKSPPEADFTAEGSPPPGKVGSERPALPDAEPPVPTSAEPSAT